VAISAVVLQQQAPTVFLLEAHLSKRSGLQTALAVSSSWATWTPFSGETLESGRWRGVGRPEGGGGENTITHCDFEKAVTFSPPICISACFLHDIFPPNNFSNSSHFFSIMGL
jgi:hypothetical protein